MTTETARAILGAGEVSLDVYDPVTQKYAGFSAPVDADKFEIKPDFEKKTSVSKRRKDFGQARGTVIIPKPTEITIEIAAANAQALAMQFQGVVQAFTQGSDTVNDEVVTAKLGGEVQLSKINIAESGFTVKNEAGDTTYERGRDYEVDWAAGLLKPKASGTIGDGSKLKVSFTANAVSGTRILGGRNPQIRCRARFRGVNMVDGRPLNVDVHEAVLGASSGFDFLASDFNNIQLQGEIVTPEGKSEGYEVRDY